MAKLFRSIPKALAMAGLAAAMGISTGLQAQEIKISHQWKAQVDGRDRATRLFVSEVEKADPSLKFRIYPAQSLGIKPVAQLDALQNGTLEMAVFPMSYAVGKAQEFSAVILPGTIPNLDFAMSLKKTGYYTKLQELSEKHGFRIITWWWTPGGFAAKDKAVTGPESVSGMKLRAADPTFESMLKAAGASVTAMASTEIYSGLQSGVLNGTLTSAETFVSMRLYEQTKHATVGGESALWMLLQPLVMSKQAWDKLTPKQKKIFQEAADKSDAFFLTIQRESTMKMAEAYVKAGGTSREMSKAEFDAWVALAKKTAYPEYAKLSPTAKGLLDELLKAAAPKKKS
ncbi:MAG: ABC transporter substrate-binding protein [Betaproteobacteria bacterium]|nr:ABC transporter substrate-binding protein [Betaproteobacteria bacterium]